MEEKNALLPSKLKLAMKDHAQWIVSWELGTLGHHALFLVEVVLVLEHVKSKLTLILEEKPAWLLKNQ